MGAAQPILSAQALAARQRAHERHFIRRAHERFGLKLTPERYAHLIAKVQENANGTKFLRHMPPNRTVWRIRAGGHAMAVVYDHTSDRLVTCLFLPHDRTNLRRAAHR
jgi:hypothetical protein